MTTQDVVELQTHLAELGFYGGAIDGIAGPQTTRAYEAYWASRPVEIGIPVVTPAPSRPWWLSRGVWGSLLTLAAVGAGFVGMGFDAEAATDALMPIIETVPLILAAFGAVLSWWGRKHATAPIDPTLVARVGGRDYRWPSRVQHHPMPSDIDGVRRGDSPRPGGPFDTGH